MTVTFLKNIPFTTCQSPFLSRLKTIDSLPQCVQLANFILSNNIQDFSQTDINNPHEAIGLIVNHKYCSLDDLRHKIISASRCARTYLYLAINKFYIYSTVDAPGTQSNDYDTALIEYCRSALDGQFVLLNYTVRSDDDGLLGNFIHPVTTMFFKKNDQAPS
jgi:hypothetical protein